MGDTAGRLNSMLCLPTFGWNRIPPLKGGNRWVNSPAPESLAQGLMRRGGMHHSGLSPPDAAAPLWSYQVEGERNQLGRRVAQQGCDEQMAGDVDRQYGAGGSATNVFVSE